MGGISSALGRRIVAYMILASAALSLLAAAFQLYTSYQRDLDRVFDELDTIETSFRPSLEEALWQFDFVQIDALLDGILAQPDVARVVLTDTSDKRFERTASTAGQIVERDLTLTHVSHEDTTLEVGTLRVAISLTQIQRRLWSQFLTIAGSNFLKTLAASLIMLAIFERSISRHLRSIAGQASDFGVPGPARTFLLDRTPRDRPDELDDIIQALNSGQAELSEAIEDARTARNRLETVLNAATGGIVALDADKFVRVSNPEARKMLGSGPDYSAFVWPENITFMDVETRTFLSESEDPVQRALNGEELQGEIFLMDGSKEEQGDVYVRIESAALADDPDGIRAVVVFDDVSAQERHRQVLERKGRLDALGQLTGGIAHDFNNLLASTYYAVELAGRTTDPARQAHYHETAIGSIRRGRDLTSRLLAFARKQPGIAKSRDLSKVFQDFKNLISPMIEANVTLRLKLEDATLAVFCDQTQLETALMNLVLNSRDAILKSGKGDTITIRARATERMEHGDAQSRPGAPVERLVEISVSDNGPGMDRATRLRATDPFFTTKDASSGTGLGLSMVYGFIQQSDGEMRIYSEEGIGTTIGLFLPRSGEPGPHEATGPDTAQQRGQGETILLVEDEGDLRDVMSTFIAELGYEVVVASRASESLEILSSDRTVDMLLTDIIMPGQANGFELASLAREIVSDLPVLFMSGYADFDPSEMGSVTAEVLQKPAPPHLLAAAIRKTLATSGS